MLSTRLGRVGRWLRYDQLLTAALVWLAVTVVASQQSLSLATLLTALALAAILTLLWIGPFDRLFLRLGIIACLAWGWVSWMALNRAPVSISHPITVTGTVVELPQRNDRVTRLTVRVSQANDHPLLVGHRVTLDVPEAPILVAGSVIRFDARSLTVGANTRRLDPLRAVAAHFAADGYESLRVDRSLRGRLTQWRAHVVARSTELWREPAASLAAGLTVGNRANFDAGLATAMEITGTTHLVAVSGENLVVLLWLLSGFLPVRSGWRRTILAWVGLVTFTLLTGATASVVRAALLVGAGLAASALGRPTNSLRSIILVATAMVVVNPYLATYDLGFQLSFAAVLGIATLGQRFEHHLVGPRQIRVPMALTLAAYLATAPIIAGSFGSVSLSAPIVNLIVGLLTSIAMAGAILAVASSFVWSLVGHLLAWLTWPLLAAVIGIVQWFAQQSIPVLALAPPPWLVWLMTAALILLPAWHSLSQPSPLEEETPNR